jgi:hypothetical protein
VLDTTTDRWVRLPVIPDGGYRGHTIVAAGTKLVAIGGVDWTSQMGAADLSDGTWIWSPATTS